MIPHTIQEALTAAGKTRTLQHWQDTLRDLTCARDLVKDSRWHQSMRERFNDDFFPEYPVGTTVRGWALWMLIVALREACDTPQIYSEALTVVLMAATHHGLTLWPYTAEEAALMLERAVEDMESGYLQPAG